ncbi:TonB-linked outer membrane protein, SusC/RagA family [Pustulibacterium marinum]|uniref:TonB-linked outer membrane protein, SusC/RagA family n=1 Tax=Pustulibacterium marinum TaxID=1224947 RepID=A0A1I7EUG6_9FLAO|nr:TonB-dependent receptor [Pustulibacterium marinum]SFU27542.1 TonB-linked outer membrane protein, SusC/RagA family [Pustulibacterium marinum]
MRINTLIPCRERLRMWVLFSLCLLATSQVFSQTQRTITGTVVEEGTNMPLPGVNVLEKGTKNGTATDFDGNFSITVSSDSAILEISYIGFKTQEVSTQGTSTLTVNLLPDFQSLDEVVVVGYGTQKKSDLTGAIGSVDTEALTERKMTNPLEALQGNVPGVQISNSTGRVGDGFDIVIRGQNSISGNNSPLFVVDGVPVDNIDFLNPQDIERMDILKDASSTAIYGSRGTNGVVIITTKNGSQAKGGLTVSVDSYFGVKEVARLPEMMNGSTWWRYHQSAYLATASVDPNTGTVTEETLYDAVVGTQNDELLRRAEANETYDWYDIMLKTGTQSNNFINVAGRSDNGLGYNIGMGYQKETGNIENESLDKYTFNVGVNHRINDKFSLGGSIKIALTEQQDGSAVAMRDAFRLNPFLSPYGLDGELFERPGKLTDANGDFIINKTSTYNPILTVNNTSDETRRWKGIGNMFFEYTPLPWLSFKTNFSTSFRNLRRGRYWGLMSDTGASLGQASAEVNKSENFNYTWDNQMNINYVYNDKHAFNFLALQSVYMNKTEYSSQYAYGFPFETGFYNTGSGAQSSYIIGTDYLKQQLSSFALRLNYTFDDKYLLTLSTRWDGSSLFPKEYRWDSFPSAALGWRISQEDFLADNKTISNLKLRASYGYTGNNVIDPYSTTNILDLQTYYDFNGTAANGWIPGSLANSTLQWERTREFNFGIDYGFLNNKISGSIELYDRKSKDLLLQQDLPSESGWPSVAANVGEVSNKGIEATLSTQILNTDDFSWDATVTFTKNTNEVLEIYGQTENDDVGNNLFIGESLNSYYNYVFDGVWQADEAAEAASYNQSEGQAKVKDINGDGQITPDDRVILGNSNPDWSGSFFTRVKWKQFDLSTSIITNQGVLVYSPFHENFTNVRDRGRQKLDINWYIPENDAGLPAQASNEYPQARNEGTYWRNNGVGYYRDASFVKVKNIALGYTLPSNALKKLGNIKYLRFYANVLNPFVFTDYDGYDPEWATANLGIGRTSYVTYQLGLSLKF